MWPFKKKATAEQVDNLLRHVSVLAERIDDLGHASRARSDHAADQLTICTKTMTQHMGQLQQATSTQGVAIASINENLVRIVVQMQDIKKLEKQVADSEAWRAQLETEVELAGKHAANLENERDKLREVIDKLQTELDHYVEQYNSLSREYTEVQEQLGNSESDAQANIQIMHSLRESCNRYETAVTELMRERDDLKSQLQKHIMASVVQSAQAGQVANQQVSPPPPVELSASTQSFLQGLAADLQRALQSNAVGANLQQPNPPVPIGGLDSAAVYNVASSTEDAAAKQYAGGIGMSHWDSSQAPTIGASEVESALRSLANPIQFTPAPPEIVGTAQEGTGQVEIGTSAGFAPTTSRPVLLPSQQQYLLESGISLQP